MDLYEIIRRWHNGQRKTEIANILDYDRKTVRKYIHYAKEKGLSRTEALPPKEKVLDLIRDIAISENKRRPATAQEILKPYLQEIIDLVNHEHIPLKPKIAFEVICEKYDLENKVSYSSFKRFVRSNRIAVSPGRVTCRIEVDPGSELQVDYGYMGVLYDPVSGQRRKVYAFIATLSYSRHQYVEFIYRQTKESFVSSHIRAFEYFGGVTVRLVLDNLKSGVLKPDLYDPVFNPAYRDMAIHYHCFLDPCRPGEPKHKGKVESQVKTVRQQFRKMLALNPNIDIYQANNKVKEWCLGPYGHRDHGTTGWKPYPVFMEHEKSELKPLPAEPFEIPAWKECTVHADHYIQFDKKVYSVPTPFIGKKLWVKRTDRLIQVFHENSIIKQHVVTSGYRHTDWNDFPENMRKALDQGLPAYLQKEAGKVGPHFRKLIRHILEPHAFINLRRAQGLVGLIKKHNHKLLERTAQTALEQKLTVRAKSFVELMEKLEQQHQETTQIPISLFTQEFIRPMDYFTQDQ